MLLLGSKHERVSRRELKRVVVDGQFDGALENVSHLLTLVRDAPLTAASGFYDVDVGLKKPVRSIGNQPFEFYQLPLELDDRALSFAKHRARSRLAKEVRHVDPQRRDDPMQGRQRRARLVGLDLRDHALGTASRRCNFAQGHAEASPLRPQAFADSYRLLLFAHDFSNPIAAQCFPAFKHTDGCSGALAECRA